MRFNKAKKGARSYYTPFCTVSQAKQFFDFLHRPRNIHDSNGADEFIMQCLQKARAALPHSVFESRMDSALFTQTVLSALRALHFKFTATVSFEQFSDLKSMIEDSIRWGTIEEAQNIIPEFHLRFPNRRTLTEHNNPIGSFALLGAITGLRYMLANRMDVPVFFFSHNLFLKSFLEATK